MQTFVKQEIETHQKLFGEMLDRFGISAKPLAERAGVSEVQLSRFRNGKTDLGAGKLMALLENVPQEAREWYLSQLLGVSLKTSLRSFIQSASPKEKAEALNLLADWIESRDSTETKLMPEAV
ncbi:transcriptional regulator [Cyanosarcina cf. burmensis CCALA 770]|nr:transcriptional regulator [Cyanosarcina cf. burmensis CCALA 770]